MHAVTIKPNIAKHVVITMIQGVWQAVEIVVSACQIHMKRVVNRIGYEATHAWGIHFFAPENDKNKNKYEIDRPMGGTSRRKKHEILVTVC
jgi:hypothetical protein